jgi:hypothetical protein
MEGGYTGPGLARPECEEERYEEVWRSLAKAPVPSWRVVREDETCEVGRYVV